MSVRTFSNCSFAWTKGSGGEDLVNAEGFMHVIEGMGRKASDATPWGHTIQRHAISQIVSIDRLIFGMYGKPADATPPIPTGVQGSMVVRLSTGDTYTMPLKMVGLSIQASNKNPEQAQVYLYEAVLSSDTGSASELAVASA